jgi:uncharacterized phage infection (PIP) family protein YhgE
VFAPLPIAQDARRRTLASVITFLTVLMGLWAILSFMGALASTLAAIADGNERLKEQLSQSNAGLASISDDTANLNTIAADSARLGTLLDGIDRDLTTMIGGVSQIGTSMAATEASLGTLEGDLAAVNSVNADMARSLARIDRGLGKQVRSVRTMRRDVDRTRGVLASLPPALAATNGRLGHINNAVNTMGCRGVVSALDVRIEVGPISPGSARVFATVVPPGAWGVAADGVSPC